MRRKNDLMKPPLVTVDRVASRKIWSTLVFWGIVRLVLRVVLLCQHPFVHRVVFADGIQVSVTHTPKGGSDTCTNWLCVCGSKSVDIEIQSKTSLVLTANWGKGSGSELIGDV